jgi:hypothetical protein
MALGVYHQTLLMAAVCAGFAALLMVFEPHEQRQLQHLLVYAFGSLFVMLMAALSFLTSYNDIVPPYAYSITMGAAVVAANLAYITWAVCVLKRAFDAQWPTHRIKSMVLQLLAKFMPSTLAGSRAMPGQQQQPPRWLWKQGVTATAAVP